VCGKKIGVNQVDPIDEHFNHLPFTGENLDLLVFDLHMDVGRKGHLI
jgi:hypothetical protein